MSPELNEWLQLFGRWIHVFASILWVGTTYYFTWLDGRFVELEKLAGDEKEKEKNVWMVHSGGFYVVEKQKIPQLMPQTLHWFKWEAAITWLSGFFLFGLVYYHGGMMVEAEDWPIKKGLAIALSFGLLIVGWAVYDLLLTKLFKNEIVGIIVSFLLITGLAYIFTRGIKALNLPPLFPARASYMQLGSMLGTIMTANVWMRILPPQRRMVAALKAGQQPDLAEGARAKMRSKHNTFIVLPVVFLMISNHYAGITLGSPHNWLILSGMVLLGWLAAMFLRKA